MKKMRRGRSWILAACLLLGVLALTLPASAGNQRTEITAENQYASAKDSVLYLRSWYASGSLKATGSGFLVSPDGLAVTAAHVIDKGARVTALTTDGRELECAVLSCDTATDVAVIRLPKGKYSYLTLADRAPSGGAVVRAMGYPQKETMIITEGIVSSPAGSVSGKMRTLVSCQLVNGMSGGPVFDRFGQVVGVCSGSVRTMSGIHLSALWSDLTTAVNSGKETAK